MVGVVGRTREEVRLPIGYNVDAVKLIEADASGSTTTLLTDDLFGAADEHNGKWLVFTSGSNNDGQIRRVTDSAVSSNRTTLTFYPAVTDATANNDTAELWSRTFDPERIHDFINQAVMEATGRIFDPEEDISLFADHKSARYDIPSQFSMINKVEYRSSIQTKRVHACDRLFDETTDGSITQSLDTEDYKQGSESLKLVYAAGASANDLITDSFTALDISHYTHLEMWIKSTVAASAADLHLLLDDSSSSASPLETLVIPALVADTWTYVRIALANPELDTALISIGFRYSTDLGACTIWLDDIRVVNNDSAIWTKVAPHLWRIDKQARDLMLTVGGLNTIGYSLMKLTGGGKPTLLTTDSGVCEVPEDFVIAHATALAFASASGGPSTDPDARRQAAAFWFGKAERARATFPLLSNTRMVD